MKQMGACGRAPRVAAGAPRTALRPLEVGRPRLRGRTLPGTLPPSLMRHCQLDGAPASIRGLSRSRPNVGFAGTAKVWASSISAFALVAVLGGCGMERAGTLQKHEGRPQRVVSIDFCADQYVLRFVDRARILAVSPDAGREFSYMRQRALGLPTVRPVVEDVIILKPDLVVRSYGGGPQAAAMFQRAGVPVHGVGWASNFPEIARTIRETAGALGSPAEGQAVANEMTGRLAALAKSSTAFEQRCIPAARIARRSNIPDIPAPCVLPAGHSPSPAPRPPPGAMRHDQLDRALGHKQAPRTTALYMTSGGATSGPGTLIHAMLTAAGLENFQDRPGWRTIPLERLAYQQPDLIAAAFFSSATNHHRHAWSPTRHPLAQTLLAKRTTIPIQGAWTACGGWFLTDAVEALADAAHTIEAGGIGR